MNQSTDKSAQMAEINTPTQVNYDQDLAVALGLDADINIDFESDFKNDKKINPILSLATQIVKEFQGEMAELNHKFRSAAAKMSALIFMPTNMMADQLDSENTLQFSAILIKQSDNSQLSKSITPSAPPIATLKSSDENKRDEEAALTKMALKQQLQWFREFGRHGLINTAPLVEATINETASPAEKTKRHLTLIADQVQAA